MLPLGIVYFTVVVTCLSVSLALIAAPIGLVLGHADVLSLDPWNINSNDQPWLWPIAMLVGVLLLFVTLHIARGVGYLHALLAKHMLVKTAQYD